MAQIKPQPLHRRLLNKVFDVVYGDRPEMLNLLTLSVADKKIDMELATNRAMKVDRILLLGLLFGLLFLTYSLVERYVYKTGSTIRLVSNSIN